MKMTRVLAILLTLLMVFGVVACDNEQPQVDPSGRTIVTMTYWNKQDTMQPLIDLIEKQLPDVKIQYNYVSMMITRRIECYRSAKILRAGCLPSPQSLLMAAR